MSSLRTVRAAGPNLKLLQAVTMLREDDLDEAKETAETKGELSREDVHDILQGIQTTRMARSCRLTAGA